ncbi:MAG: hypothetical protein ACFFD3_04610 [Candidatus Thorarchaeota archaeon]
MLTSYEEFEELLYSWVMESSFSIHKHEIVNLNEEIVAWSMTLGSGIAAAVILLLALMLLLKGVKPLMNEIDITFG